MKKIPEPDLSAATILTPAELNRIHFAGNHTPLSPEQIKEISQDEPNSQSAKTTDIIKK